MQDDLRHGLPLFETRKRVLGIGKAMSKPEWTGQASPGARLFVWLVVPAGSPETKSHAALADLAGATQVAIVTHNRGTIRVADTVYGITMGEDGASQAISLRLDEGARAGAGRQRPR